MVDINHLLVFKTPLEYNSREEEMNLSFQFRALIACMSQIYSRIVNHAREPKHCLLTEIGKKLL